MHMPRFTADSSLYRTSGHYRAAAALASDFGGLAFPAAVKGTHCVPDPDCSTGFSRIFCPNFDPESCRGNGSLLQAGATPAPTASAFLSGGSAGLYRRAAFAAVAARERTAATTITAAVRTVRLAEHLRSSLLRSDFLWTRPGRHALWRSGLSGWPSGCSPEVRQNPTSFQPSRPQATCHRRASPIAYTVGAMDTSGVIKSLFGVPRALVGVVHTGGLPGTPAAIRASTRLSRPRSPRRASTRQPASMA